MTNLLRELNEEGTARFLDYLARVRDGAIEAPPFALLTDPTFSAACPVDVSLEDLTFSDRYEFGKYLASALSALDRRQISHQHKIWNWLSLFYFDAICPVEENGTRNPLRDELYVLDSKYNYLRYYKHLVRTPWMAYLDHKENSKVLFITARGVRSDIEETLTASQQVIGNPTIIEAVFKLYFDTVAGKPRRGASGKGGGSPRRLTAVIQQLALTYDIQSCSSQQFLAMLPREFSRFKTIA